MVLPAPARLPVRVLAELVAGLGLGEPHLGLTPEPLWRDPAAAGRFGRLVERHLTRLGWRRRDGEIDREVVAALAVVCRPDVGFHGWLTHEHRTTSVLAGAIGREAVLAVRSGNDVTVRSVHRQRLAERLAAHLPDVPAGAGPPLRVDLAELRATDPSGGRPTEGGAGLRRVGPQVRRAAALVAAPTTGAGELYPVGGRAPVSYVDSAHGRYLVATTRDVLEIRPATRADVTAELQVQRSAAATVGNPGTPPEADG